MLDGMRRRVRLPRPRRGAVQVRNGARECGDEQAGRAADDARTVRNGRSDAPPRHGSALSEGKVGRLLVPSPDTAGPVRAFDGEVS